ncbi:putative ribonuclease H-like domain-containing protein [Tanacetum coccineum]
MLFHLHLQALFAPPTIDLSNSSLEEFQQPEFEGYGPKPNKSVCKDTSNEIESAKQQEKSARKLVKYAEMYRSQKPKGNQRNWNNLKSQQLGGNFMMYNEACFICESFDHVQDHYNYHQRERMVNGNNYTRVNYNYSAKKAHPNSHRHMTPRVVLMKTGLKPFNTARPVNTAHPKTTVYSARPMSCFSKLAQSTVKMYYQSRTALTNKNLNQKVNTVKEKVYTAKPKAINTAWLISTVVNAIRANQGHPQKEDQGYVNSGRSRHMTCNMSYLSNFKEFDGGYVTLGKRAVGTKLIFRNKKDERGTVTRNKARLVAQGYTQEKGIDYDEVFAPVARIKAIRLLLAYASFMGFLVYQMDVKSAFLYGTIKEEVYVCQPLGFEDLVYPDKVYKVVKALYGLHQALRAWYRTLAKYLLDNGFQRGKIDQTLFIKKKKGDILLVQVYVDEIIFGSTNKELCTEFENLMHV